MIFKKLKSEIVSHLSYFIGSRGEAFVVDPQRDCSPYVDIAHKYGVRIKYVFETHRNEDYVIGSRELACMTGAEIYHGPWPEFMYGITLEDGQEFIIGNLKVRAIHTPGHTPGCISYSVIDLSVGDETVLVCTGDTIFVGDVGRTDFGDSTNRREWSENLYNSILKKLLPLGDHVILCPAHSSGSVCGGSIADREMSTLGLERLMNPMLQKTREEFIDIKVNEHHEYAPYFRMMEKLNVEGAPFVGYGMNPLALKPVEFKEMMDRGAVILDTRPPTAFGAGHIKGSYSLNLKRLGLAGWVLPYNKPILLILGDQSHLNEVARGLLRIGYDNISGYLAGTIVTWYKAVMPVERLDMMTVIELKERIDNSEDWLVLDVRNMDEYIDGHIHGSLNIYVGLLEERLEDVPEGRNIAVICKSGTRSGLASSILLKAGRKGITNVLGGMDAWKNAGYSLVK